MVYNIRDWVTQGGMVLFSESILLMKIAVLNTKQKNKNPTNGIQCPAENGTTLTFHKKTKKNNK